MEYPCAKCGTVVEEGIAFCPHCREPQIRVVGFETTGPPGEAGAVVANAAFMARPADFSGHVQWRLALPAAAVGGVASLLLSFSAVAVLGPVFALPMLVWVPLYASGGVIAVLLYRARQRALPIAPAQGAKIGAAAAGFGFLVVAFLMLWVVGHDAPEIRTAMTNAISQMSQQGGDHQVVQQFADLIKTDEGLHSLVALVLGMFFVVFMLASSIGGAVCAAILRRRYGAPDSECIPRNSPTRDCARRACTPGNSAPTANPRSGSASAASPIRASRNIPGCP